MTDMILHHYPTSPFSEKVRVAFGIKGASWKSVVIPTMMPKPDLMPLTGGYRKTPVMQVGADIYCDSQIILRELERRHPSPPLGTGGLGEGIAFWADRPLFWSAVAVAFGVLGENIPDAFLADRAAFSGRSFDRSKMKPHAAVMEAQVLAHLGWVEQELGDGRDFLLGGSVSLADVAVYHSVWFLRDRAKSPVLAGLARLNAWADRMKAFGNGNRSDLDSKAALEIARAAKPAAHGGVAANALGLKAGDAVSIAADDTGRDPVSGTLVALDVQSVTLRREDPQVGEVHVHFPRAGFILTPAK